MNFLTKAIFAGCTFTYRMYAKYANLQDAKSGNKLKPHYHIQVDGEFRLDCEIWRIFLTHHRVWAVCRPMVDLDATTSAKQLKFFWDASANPKLGMGAIFNNQWLYTKWKLRYITENGPRIEYLELLALTAALLTWGEQLCNQHIAIFCDNQAVVSMINNASSSCKKVHEAPQVHFLEQPNL